MINIHWPKKKTHSLHNNCTQIAQIVNIKKNTPLWNKPTKK